jgi:hypothetical protein
MRFCLTSSVERPEAAATDRNLEHAGLDAVGVQRRPYVQALHDERAIAPARRSDMKARHHCLSEVPEGISSASCTRESTESCTRERSSGTRKGFFELRDPGRRELAQRAVSARHQGNPRGATLHLFSEVRATATTGQHDIRKQKVYCALGHRRARRRHRAPAQS